MLRSGRKAWSNVDQFAAPLMGFDIVLIAGIESRIFLFSTLLASQLNIGSMMVRKKKQDTELETQAQFRMKIFAFSIKSVTGRTLEL